MPKSVVEPKISPSPSDLVKIMPSPKNESVNLPSIETVPKPNGVNFPSNETVLYPSPELKPFSVSLPGSE